jgi:hypothetical protein
MFIIFAILVLIFLAGGAKARYQRQQIKVAKTQLATAQAQALMAEDLLAITAAPEALRPQILKARIDARKKAQDRKAILTLGGVVVAAAVIAGMFGSHSTSSTSAASSSDAATSTSTPTPAVSGKDQGLADRKTWEAWFTAKSGDYRSGALYWVGQRSLAKPGACATLKSNDAQNGCLAAKAMLDPFDARRKTEPEYRIGWNSYGAPAPVTPAAQTDVRLSPQDVRAQLADACREIAITYAHMGEGYYDAGSPGRGEDPLANLISAYQTHMPACLNSDNGFSTPYSDAAARKALGL